MKKIIVLSLVTILISPVRSTAQSDEVQQLLLNVEKLAQLKQILSDFKKGYAIVSTGYNTIRNISEGNFNLHKTFLDGLLSVTPQVKNYRKLAEIIKLQAAIVQNYKSAFNRFKSEGNFNPKEISYISNVYSNLLTESRKNIEELTTIITANKLRMSDDERLNAIDLIHDDMQDKLVFIRYFNNNTSILATQRSRERRDAKTLKSIYGINQ